ncbi:MAG: hypothetical protein ABMB14_15335 [Myxococcota bacterium]
MKYRSALVPLLAGFSLAGGCTGNDLVCGENTHEQDGACVADDPSVVTHTVNHTNTVPNTVTNTVTDGELDPGQYEEVLVEIQELVGRGGALGTNGSGETHMHIAEMKYREGNGVDWPNALFYCSYTFGVLDGANLDSMPFLAQGFKFLPRTGTRDPGCMHMAFDESDPDIVYTTHHGNLDDGDPFVSGFDLNSTAADPLFPTKLTLAPIQLPMVQIPGEVYEGLDVENGLIWVAAHQTGLAVFRRDAANANALERMTTYPGLVDARDVAVVGDTAYVCDAANGLVILDVTDPTEITETARLTLPGVVLDIAVGDAGVVYLAAQSGGLLSVDVSDPANPVLLQQLNVQEGVTAVDYDQNRVYVAAWNDARVYDATDPSNLTIIGAKRLDKQKNYSAEDGDGGDRPDLTNRVLGIAGSGDYVFDGTWWVPHNLLLHPDRTAPYMVLPETVNYLAFPGDLAIGESSEVEFVVRNDGTAPLTVFDLWTTNPAFTVSPPQLRVDPGASGTLKVTFTATIGAGESTTTTTGGGTVPIQTGEETGFLQIWSDDPSQPVREAYLVGNPAGIGVGDPYTNSATLLDGTPWSFQDDALGQVTLVAYFATF